MSSESFEQFPFLTYTYNITVKVKANEFSHLELDKILIEEFRFTLKYGDSQPIQWKEQLSKADFKRQLEIGMFESTTQRVNFTLD
jgi:hypothetical protein